MAPTLKEFRQSRETVTDLDRIADVRGYADDGIRAVEMYMGGIHIEHSTGCGKKYLLCIDREEHTSDSLSILEAVLYRFADDCGFF